MASVFGWLDSSEGERRRALDVIDLFKQRETIDELGIGSVRDAIADLIAPGTSTIQTRARYFFFIPWIFLNMERSRIDATKVPVRARQREVELIKSLANSPDPRGTIGIEAGAALKRLPSAIYWAGMGRLGIRLFQGTQDLYHRSFGKDANALTRDETGDLVLDVTLPGDWNPHIPLKPDSFPDLITFDLTGDEARFFQEQLRMHATDSLFQSVVDLGEDMADIAFPWEHPRRADFPSVLRGWLKDGQCYAELIHGAQLLYNLMLAEERPLPKSIDLFRNALDEWAALLSAQIERFQRWDRSEFWRRLRELNPRLPLAVEGFSENWFSRVLALSAPAAVKDDIVCRSLLAEREFRLKGSRSRLRSRAHLDTWGGDSGSARLNYRWAITRSLAQDVVDGLRR